MLQKTQTRKENEYDQWVSKVEHDLLSFQYLHGGMDPTTKVFLQEIGLSDCDQAQAALYCLYSYAAGSVFPPFIHRVHKGISLLSKPPCQFNPQFPGDQPVPCNSRVVPF